MDPGIRRGKTRPARACGLVFFINKLAGSNKEVGIKATVDTLADLMVEDLSQGSSALRNKLPGLLKKCELLMSIGDEYRIQTEEYAAWNDDLHSQRILLANEVHRVENERNERIRKKNFDLLKKVVLFQGSAKVPRTPHLLFDAQLPSDAEKKVTIWVRDGWSINENSILAEAQQAGNHSPTVFVFIPKCSAADDLRHYLIEYQAAKATLDKRGLPKNPEGIEARAAIETHKQAAENKIEELLEEAFGSACVFQGGSKVLGVGLLEPLREAVDSSLQRLYPQFGVADHAGWDKVYAKAKEGAPEALKWVGFDSEPCKHAVCRAIQGYVKPVRGVRTSETTSRLHPMAGHATLLMVLCRYYWWQDCYELGMNRAALLSQKGYRKL